MEKFFPDKRVHKLSIKDRIILKCMKLDLDLRLSILSIFSSTISENHCRFVFLDVLVKFSAILKIVDTVVVLDCIEF